MRLLSAGGLTRTRSLTDRKTKPQEFDSTYPSQVLAGGQRVENFSRSVSDGLEPAESIL
jgi:hypothetical protein